MIENNIVKIKSPIKVIPSEHYYLIIEDANGVRHYWHNKHESKEYGNFKEGAYDGWSKQVGKLELETLKV